ncbi:MAG: HAMP domain-containing sensor histidine kinase [Candidatus Sphingomonas phytovorans]|nr:HAMP domain-containing sensor histidine kinase [Sphingomonas sp.]WEJ99161.1 MAG: HAMP domain-containing sensor histidine kinase [Sphingomonas sp.]
MLSERLRLRDVRRTSAFRLTVILGSLFSIGVVALLALIYFLTEQELTARNDRILRAQASLWLAVPAADLPARIDTDIDRGDRGLSYGGLFSHRGERLAGNMARLADLPPNQPTDIEGNGRRGPVRLLRVSTSAGETIMIGRDISQIRDLRQRILVILVLSGLAAASGMMLAAIALSLHPLRRVRDLQRFARRIAAGYLEVRMPIAGRGDELDQFARTVNVMVDDVERLMEQVKGVTDAIAHDLRTPLTRVRAQLHRARQFPDISEGLAELLATAEADLEIALDRFTALLRISEIEAGARRAAFAPTEIARLLSDVFDLYEPLAEERGLSFRLDTSAAPQVQADEKLLFEAIGNLVDNAIKFAVHQVTLKIACSGNEILAEVRDDGPGIAVEEREAVLRRFHRGSKAATYPGSGLGLSVVAAILHLHDFELELADGSPGLVARVRMPRRHGPTLPK